MALWDEQAKKWALLGSPLRPCEQDIAISSAWIKEFARTNLQPLSVLLLGVTPEIANITWPIGTKLFAVDNNLSMIKSILPPQTPTLKPMAIAGDWLNLPFPLASMDIVIGDGCYSTLLYEHYAKMTQEIWRVLKPSGSLIMRYFMRPNCAETLDSIKADFQAGNISNFHILKWRLAMALHGTLEEGVCLNNIWQTWAQNFKPNNEMLFEKLQWSKNLIETIDNYKNNSIHYTFPTLAEIRKTLASFFIEGNLVHPSYALGERCPLMQFSPIKNKIENEINTLSIHTRSPTLTPT